jgi:hypothetical protein
MEDGRPRPSGTGHYLTGGDARPPLRHTLCLILQALPLSGLSGLVYND